MSWKKNGLNDDTQIGDVDNRTINNISRDMGCKRHRIIDIGYVHDILDTGTSVALPLLLGAPSKRFDWHGQLFSQKVLDGRGAQL